MLGVGVRGKVVLVLVEGGATVMAVCGHGAGWNGLDWGEGEGAWPAERADVYMPTADADPVSGRGTHTSCSTLQAQQVQQ